MKLFNKLFKTRNKEIETDHRQLLSLLEMDYVWAQKKNWPIPNRYPHYKKMRLIGEALHSSGGINLMREKCNEIYSKNSTLGQILEHIWEDIGDWKP